MFQRAEPDEAGFGVTISTPGLIRSSQPLMFFGLPLRHHDDDDRVGHDALGGAGVPVLGDQAGLDQAGDVALEREVDVVGLEAVDHGAALVAGGAVGLAPSDALAVGGLGELVLDRLVGLLRHGEADEVQRGRVRAFSGWCGGAADAAAEGGNDPHRHETGCGAHHLTARERS